MATCTFIGQRRPSDHRVRLTDRIVAAYKASAERPVRYRALLEAMYPPAECPKSWRVSSGNGPPGCAIPFGVALRKLGGQRFGEGGQFVHIPGIIW